MGKLKTLKKKAFKVNPTEAEKVERYGSIMLNAIKIIQKQYIKDAYKKEITKMYKTVYKDFKKQNKNKNTDTEKVDNEKVSIEAKKYVRIKWTEEDDSTLLRLKKQKFKWKTISALLNRTYHSCVYRFNKIKN